MKPDAEAVGLFLLFAQPFHHRLVRVNEDFPVRFLESQQVGLAA